MKDTLPIKKPTTIHNSLASGQENGQFFFPGNNNYPVKKHFFSPAPVQSKSITANSNDPFEREADKMADKIVQEAGSKLLLQTGPLSFANKHEVQKKCASCIEEGTLQRKAEDGLNSIGMDGKGEGLAATKGTGQPLPEQTRQEMESSFGADFMQVRIHTNDRAVQMSRGLQAQAFTHGSDIYFNEGRYQPDTHLGRHLLAHELTHTIQQGSSPVLPSPATERTALENNISTTGHESTLQRMHLEGGRKKFDAPRYIDDVKLEACLNDEDKVRPFDRGTFVTKLQEGLLHDGGNLGQDKTTGVYGADTGQSVIAFKKKYRLGSYEYPDAGPGTMKKLDELETKPQPPDKKKPEPEKKTPEDNCGPGTNNPFCLPFPNPNTEAPCQPYATEAEGKMVWEIMKREVPAATSLTTWCGEVGRVWEAYFAATSAPFAFSDISSCVVQAAMTDPEASSTLQKLAKRYFQDIINYLPITLQGIMPNPFPLNGKVAEKRLPLEEAIGPHGERYLHPDITYNTPTNAAANLVGGTGTHGQGSDIFGDDDRKVSGRITIEIWAIDSGTGMMRGQVRWLPQVHVKDTVDFCPGNLSFALLRTHTVPMSKLEAMGLTRDVPITIDYDLDVQQGNFDVAPLIGPPKPNAYVR